MIQNPITKIALQKMTDSSAFEELCCDLLAVCGEYQGIVPQGVGRIDGGRDATLVRRDPECVTVVRKNVVFHFSLRKDWKKKLLEDLNTTKERGIPADHVVFITSQDVSPGDRDKHALLVKETFGWTLETLGQHWLRTNLNGEFQRLRKQYLGIDFDPRVFRDLMTELARPERHPNRKDLEAGAYFRNDVYHERIHGFLENDRKCLIVGKPGRGKTALAKAIGWEIMARDVRQTIFYVQAGIHESTELLRHISAFDHNWVTFILDDCHRDPVQVLELLGAWSDIQNAQLLLVSWPFDASAGTTEEELRDILDAFSVSVSEPNKDMIGQIVERIVKRDHLANRDPGPLESIIARCRGDLHILEFLVRAWQTQPTGMALGDVPEASILNSVYARYVGADREPYCQHIAAIAALSQFEIPVESRWIQDETAIVALRTDAFVEHTTEPVEGVPMEYLRYFHSTPARYVVEAVHRKGILHTSTSDSYVVDRIANYIRSHPGNLFQVFVQLRRSGRVDLQKTFFADKSVIEAIDRFVGSVRVPPSAEWLLNFGMCLSQVWLLEGNSTETTQRLLQTFKARVRVDERRVLFRSLTLDFAREWSKIMWKIDPDLVSELVTALDWKTLGERSRHLRLVNLERIFDYASEVGVIPTNLNVFCSALDLNGLGERSPDGLARVRRFLERGRRAGVSAANLNTFCSALDLKGLGERSCDVGLATVKNFLQLARQAGVSAANLNTFCKGLDWRHIGQSLSLTLDESPPLFEFHNVCVNAGVTTEMAREFVEGMGWDAVRLVINSPSGPDIVAALYRLLVKKCGFDRKELARKAVTFEFDTWLRSFVDRPCSDVNAKQWPIQESYLRFALNGIKRYLPHGLGARIHNRSLTLRQWSILIRNLKLADAEYSKLELEPLLRDMPQHEMTKLLRDTDMLTLSLFASRFAPESGDFTWKPRVDADISEPDARDLIVPSMLAGIAHSLFALRYIGVPRWCTTLADVLDREPMLVQEKLEKADIKTVEHFLWNLLTARHDLHCPVLLDITGIGAAISEVAKKYSSDQENLAALCGTLHLWGWHVLGELTPLVKRESALAHCLEAAKLKSPRLIRLVAGLAAVTPLGLSAAARQVIRDGLDSLVFPFEVSSQILALKQCRTWIETMGNI